MLIISAFRQIGYCEQLQGVKQCHSLKHLCYPERSEGSYKCVLEILPVAAQPLVGAAPCLKRHGLRHCAQNDTKCMTLIVNSNIVSNKAQEISKNLKPIIAFRN